MVPSVEKMIKITILDVFDMTTNMNGPAKELVNKGLFIV
jgi:hypothetical protein